MPDKGNVQQKGNLAGGDVVGRDKTTNYIQEAPSSRLRELAEALKAEGEHEPQFAEILHVLEHYKTSTTSDPRTLSEKLAASGRQHKEEEAVALKQVFAKSLFKHRLSPNAQELYAYLLGKVHLLFDGHIRPLIDAGESVSQVDAETITKVISPLVDQVNDAGAPLTPQEIRGMLYFLAGNCHIAWD